MRTVLEHLRGNGNRVFAYLEGLFSAVYTSRNDYLEGAADTKEAEEYVRTGFSGLALTIHPTKTKFWGEKHLEILGILVESERAQSLFSLV